MPCKIENNLWLHRGCTGNRAQGSHMRLWNAQDVSATFGAVVNLIGPALMKLRIRSPFYDQTFDETAGCVALNDPADADITTRGNPGFPCPSLHRHQRKKR